MHKLSLLSVKSYSNFVIIDKFLLDLYLKQILRHTHRQTLNSYMAIKLTILPKWKGDLTKKEKYIKIGAFFEKLFLKKRIACTKIWEKIVKYKKINK